MPGDTRQTMIVAEVANKWGRRMGQITWQKGSNTATRCGETYNAIARRLERRLAQGKAKKQAILSQWREEFSGGKKKTQTGREGGEKNGFQFSALSFPTNHYRWYIGAIKANIQFFQFTWKEGHNILFKGRNSRVSNSVYNMISFLQYTCMRRNSLDGFIWKC